MVDACVFKTYPKLYIAQTNQCVLAKKLMEGSLTRQPPAAPGLKWNKLHVTSAFFNTRTFANRRVDNNINTAFLEAQF